MENEKNTEVMSADPPHEIRWYERQFSLDDAKTFIKANITTAARSFIAIGFYLKCVRDRELFLEDGYQSVWEFAKAEYGISMSTASRYMTMNDRFSQDGNSPNVKEEYKAFGKSQLQEMLALTDDQLEQVKPTDRVEDIRGMRKPKEIPYIELPGQHEIEVDFPDIFPEEEFEIPPSPSVQKQEFSMDIAELVEDVPEGAAETQRIEESIAISQQEPEKLSAYGTLIKVYPEDSLLTTPGCEGGHDCFSCHLQCDIRQRYCYCVEAPTGNPFPCEQISLIDSLREELGGRCQFIDLDQAYHRAGDHEPVPCCKRCKEPCQYACRRSVQKREAEEHTCNMESDACPHREGYSCTLTLDQKNKPGDGNQCERSCCWECKYHGMCEPECDSSAGRDGKRPEFDAAWFVQRWAERNRGDLKTAMQICREQQINSERAKAIQKHMAPCGYSGMHESNYGHAFNGFAGGIDFEIGRVKMNIKYGRFVVELMDLFDPMSPEYDDFSVAEVTEIVQSEPEPEEPVIKPGIQHVYEDPAPDESWKFGSLPQAKEKYIKNLARVLVEKKGKRLRYSILQGSLNDETIKWRLEDLADETDRAIEIGDDVIAYPCAEIIEFSRGNEDLGICSYIRFGTQVRKAFEEWREMQDSEAAPVKPADPDPVIDADYEEVQEDRPYTMDMVMVELLRWKDRRDSSKPSGTEPSEVMYKKACMMHDAMMALHASMGGEYDEIE